MKMIFNPPIRSALLGGLLLLPLLAGCISPQDRGDPGTIGSNSNLPPLGLGIALPSIPPKPTSFMEHPGDLQALEFFLRVEGQDLLDECGNPGGIEAVTQYLDEQEYTEAVWTLVGACSRPKTQQNEAYVEAAMRDSREKEVRDELHAEALLAIEEVAAKLNAHAGPSTVVEAEFFNELITRHQWNVASINTAFLRWGPYEDGSARDILQLSNVYLNLITPIADSASLMMIMDRYDWGQSACISPNLSELYARVQSKLDLALSLAEKHALPEEDLGVFQWHGNLVISLLPKFEYYRDHDWWVGVFATEVRAEMHLAYWENRTQATAWPTLEEAEYMVAAYRNHTRTIWTDPEFDKYLRYFEDDLQQSVTDWHTDPHFGAPGFMGTMAIRWPYADLQCQA